MSSAPSVPGVEVGASWVGGCEHVLTAGALELLAVLHGTFGQRRAGLSESRGVRDAGPGRPGGVSEAVQTVLVGFRGVEDAAGTVSDIIAARIQPAAVEMMNALALQAAEPPSGAAIRLAPSRSWSSSCTARRSWPRRWRAWASRCRSRASRKCSTHRSKACRSDATSLTRWTSVGTPVWHSTRTAALSR